MPQQQLKVMISSTALDLPEHRRELVEACLRQSMFPLWMEDMPANSNKAAPASLKLVDDADVYIGVFANRYGYVPKTDNPKQISITEMEYNRAVERKIERLIFIMDKAHPITIEDVEIENAAKLRVLKERAGAENIVRFFRSPADLRAEAINSLTKLRRPDLTEFHYISAIPTPPQAFIAHPYTLLQTHDLVGRQHELNLLTDWVSSPTSELFKAHILNIVAIGGLGKSAFTWRWFNDVAPHVMKPLAGRMWWSFYESDATFENFVARAFAYTTCTSLDQVQQMPPPEREAQLLSLLDGQPWLIVLDGLERILIAYARMDAAHLSDDDYDRQTGNTSGTAMPMPAGAPWLTSERRLRNTADPRAGTFLRKLATLSASRILVSTRLYPADLETATRVPLPGCAAKFLSGLSDDDACELWRAFGVTGDRDTLVPIFNRVGNHPLLVQALASEVAKNRRAPGDFVGWRRDHPDFDPFSLPLVQVKSHVLEFALRGLDEKSRRVLQVVAAFRMPARYDTLAALLINKRRLLTRLKPKTEPCQDEGELDQTLTDLEDRGLVGWDRPANRYDLHPIVRGVVWRGLGEDSRRSVHTKLHAHFQALSKTEEDKAYSFEHASLQAHSKALSRLDHLIPVIELYNALIGLQRYHDAVDLFQMRLADATRARLQENRQRVELLEMLFLDGLDQLPRLSGPAYQAYVLNELATGYRYSGQPERAAAMYRRAHTILSGMKPDVLLYRRINTISWEAQSDTSLSIGLVNLSRTLRLSAALRESQAGALRALIIMRKQDDGHRKAISLSSLGLILATRGIVSESNSALQLALRVFVSNFRSLGRGYIISDCAERALRLGEFSAAQSFANRAWKLANSRNDEGDLIRAWRLQGDAALGLADFHTADEKLERAFTFARTVNWVEEELPALVALAELRRQQDNLRAAREFLDDVWEAAERGPYPLFHADAFNVLAQIERDEGNTAAAVEAATKAYRLAWCDGPPFAYHWGLETAKKHLQELGAPEPEMPPFDESKFEPLPEVEIDPDDEFHVGNVTDSESNRDES